MDRKEEACAECLQKCLQIHGNNKNSSTITSFFKVMIGDQFTKVLYLPPKFAAKMSRSIDQTTFLEDSQGRQWKVTTTSVNGTLAFEEGWNTFSSDHNLQLGDFLVFSFIAGSHFYVKIFDKSACEKEVSPRNNSSKKRMRSGRFDAVEVRSCNEHDSGSMNRLVSSRATVSGSNVEKSPCFREKDEHNMNSSGKKPTRSEKNKGPKPVCTAVLEEELCYMINQGKDYEREGKTSPTVNLFNLEVEKNSCRSIGIAGAILDESLHHQLLSPLRTQIDENTTSIRSGSGSQPKAENELKKGQIENNIASEVVDIKVSIKDMSIPPAVELRGGAEECHGVGEVLKFQIDEVLGNLVSTPSSNNPLKVYRMEHSSFINNCQTIKHNIIPELNLFGPPNPIQAQNCQYGELEKIIKKERVEMTPVEVGKTIKEELVEMTPELFDDEEYLNIMVNCQNPFTIERDDNEVDKEIVIEVRNSLPSVSAVSVSAVSCVVAENLSFLNLPLSLPGRDMRWERRVVSLRDPMKRMWPVLYLEISDFNVLTSGWEAFCQANDIQAGDECIFKVENEPKGIYEVCYQSFAAIDGRSNMRTSALFYSANCQISHVDLFKQYSFITRRHGDRTPTILNS